MGGANTVYLAVVAARISHEGWLGIRLQLLQVVFDGVRSPAVLESAHLLQVLALISQQAGQLEGLIMLDAPTILHLP